ncbi:MAG: motility protein A [Halobacteriovoraceae bacterium]|nr:motility protein A [Peredibacter sp.]MBJ00325.1 motility protein A [Halobacteriovoraceae bacterium]|tara:strand:+ start:184 stop:954 length:771 start_codon:yes stop_codon:yes gene_type:complete
MDIATIVGLVLAMAAIVGSILSGGTILAFIDTPSLLVVGGGVISAVFIKWPMDQIKTLVPVYMKSIFTTPTDPKGMIEEIQKLAETARRESVFALEKVPVEDTFLKKAVTLAADNRPPEVITSILQLEIDSMVERHKTGIAIMTEVGNDGPAFGMIGTLIGLVIMLQNLSGGPEELGKSMAVAILTTFYGAVLANVFALPIANKLKFRSESEALKMNIIIAGVLGIVAGENPRVIREKLDSFLPPGERSKGEEEAA